MIDIDDFEIGTFEQEADFAVRLYGQRTWPADVVQRHVRRQGMLRDLAHDSTAKGIAKVLRRLIEQGVML